MSISMEVEPSKIPKLPGAVVIDEQNLTTGILKYRNLLNSANLWHKITVLNCGNKRFNRNFILKRILGYLKELDFIPVCFYKENGQANFFVRNCRLAIEKLCQQHLLISSARSILHENEEDVNNGDIPGHMFKLRITLGFTNTTQLVINVQDNISEVLHKRYSAVKKSLNLDHFFSDTGLKEFCTLAQPKIFYFVLHLSKQFSHLQSLKLSHNEIRILSPMECICGLKSLTSIDLRNNLIADAQELNVFKNMNITELTLDGNPVCDLFDDYTYVQAIKEVCPKIEKLDGVLLGQNGFLAFRRNFLCNTGSQDLVNQFLEHYFTLYDAPNRSVLSGIYHKDALFSITCNYIPGQVTTPTARGFKGLKNEYSLGQYKCISRNLKLLSDLARSEDYLFKGNQSIIQVLSNLPPTEHDPYTFTVDLVYSKENTVILTVTGVYREVAQNLLDVERVIGFTRTFVLLKSLNDEYNITNEQLHVSNATTPQQQRAFKIVRVPQNNKLTIEPATNDSEKKELENALKVITNLNLDWSKKCLDECNYDLTKALMLFVDLYKVDKIPIEAFEITVDLTKI